MDNLDLLQDNFKSKVQEFVKRALERDPSAEVSVTREICVYQEESIPVRNAFGMDLPEPLRMDDIVITIRSGGVTEKYGVYLSEIGKIGGARVVR